MSENPPREDDQDPAPIRHADAERLTGEGAKPEAIEDDPAYAPEEQELRDIKGG